MKCQYPRCQEEGLLSADNKDFCDTHHELVKRALKPASVFQARKKLINLGVEHITKNK